jgi:uncharacterized protein
MKRFPLLSFWILGFLLSWAAWVPLALAYQGRITPPLAPSQLSIYGAYGTAIAAILVSLATGGISPLQDLFARLLMWRVNWRWYLAALFVPAGISLISTALNVMQGSPIPDYSDPLIYHSSLPLIYEGWKPWALVIPIFLQNILFGTSLGEELAWRGFALTRLQQRFSPLQSSILLGLLWIAWQFPLTILSAPAYAREQILLVSITGAIPAAILLTWIYNRSGGSLLLVLLFNSATKMTDLFVTPSFGPAWTPVIAYWTVALSIFALGGKRALDPKLGGPSKQVPEPVLRGF